MRAPPDTRVGPCRTVGDPPGEALWCAIDRAARELGPLFDLIDYERDVLGLDVAIDEEARDAA